MIGRTLSADIQPMLVSFAFEGMIEASFRSFPPGYVLNIVRIPFFEEIPASTTAAKRYERDFSEVVMGNIYTFCNASD